MQTPESDDYIGFESCADLKSEFDPPQRFHRGTRCANSRRKSAEKEFPRPIPWLVRTENQQSQYAPWVMRRYHTDDGRLIIREERAPGHEFFVAYRSNGRLLLKLAPLDDVVEDSGHVGRLAGEDAGDGCDLR